MKLDTISIIVPVYQVEHELRRCIESLVCQTYHELEIILVDDGSTDHCPELCDQFMAKDSRIRSYHKDNSGLSDARNYGLEAATGKYILFVDADDYIEPDACERLIPFMKNTEADFAVGAFRQMFGKKVRIFRNSSVIKGEIYTPREFMELSIPRTEWYAPAYINFYSREFLVRNQLKFLKHRLFEDTEFLPRLYFAASKIVYTDVLFYNYVIRRNSITMSGPDPVKKKDELDNYTAWKAAFDRIEDEHFRRILYGCLVKHYLHICRIYKITAWDIEGISFDFAMKYALNQKEKIKAVLFQTLPWLYVRL